MKQKITPLDLKVLVTELQPLITNYRLNNIYNLTSNPRSFLLKFALPDSKVNVVVESGFKLYATDYQRPVQPGPSGFCTKLRKHLKSKRLTDVRQIGDDRAVVLQFSEGLYYLVLEFFSAGNVIILDENLKILSLLRAVDLQAEEDTGYSVGQTYPNFTKSLFEEDVAGAVRPMPDFTPENIVEWAKENQKTVGDGQQIKKSRRKKAMSITNLCFRNVPQLSSDLMEISLNANGVNMSLTYLELLKDTELVDKVVKSLEDCKERQSVLTSTPAGEVEGYILRKKNLLFDESKDESEDNLKYTYDEFHPFEPVHKATAEDTVTEKIQGYNKTLDKFFTMIERSKASLGRQQKQAAAEKRLQLVKDENAKKILHLADMEELNRKKGYLITMHSYEIDQCRASVQALLDQQMDWTNIEKLIDVERRRGNPTAKMITSLNLIKNEITVALPDEGEESNSEESESEDEDESDSETENDKKPSSPKAIKVVIDITQTAYANSTTYFDAKKSAKVKQEKTEKSAAIAIKNSEAKIALDQKKMESETSNDVEIKRLRPKMWFEKYHWFISLEGYLCIAGQDDIQIDLIYNRYFDKKADLLVSNSLDDALKVVVKNPYKNKEVPASTLQQAGLFSLTTTKAWGGKMRSSPWFVKGDGVSKKDFDGSILAPGLLNVSKEKTFLAPSPFVMGIGLLWVPNEETKNKYTTAGVSRDDEVGLLLTDPEEGNKEKIEELKQMLEKLSVSEQKAKSAANKEAGEGIEGEKVEEAEEDAETEEEPSAPAPNQQIQTRIRGKKSKLKKIKKKYGDQDEEERRLRMSVLGTLKQVEDHKQKTANEDAAKNPVKSHESAAAARERKIRLQKRQLERILGEVEESSQDEGSAKGSYSSELFGLLSAPNKTDGIEDCIVVFMPWASLRKYAYKVKVEPGNLKKGKTLSGALDLFKKETKKLQKQGGSQWFDNTGLVDMINEKDYLMTLICPRYKLSGGGEQKKGGPPKHTAKSRGGRKKKR